MSPPAWDFLIVGGGAAGLLLADQLLRSRLRDRRLLVVERDAAAWPDRTFGFWATDAGLPDDVVGRAWRRVRFVGAELDRTFDLGAYRYHAVRGADLARAVRRSLAAVPNAWVLDGAVERVEESADGARVVVDGREHLAGWVFDGRFDPARLRPDPSACRWLTQSFEGWEVRTARDAFDPGVVTLMDVRTPQRGALRFFHVLPFSARRALVEHVVCASRPAPPGEHESALRDYLAVSPARGDYAVVRRERGATPLTDYAFPRRFGRRVLTVGIAGGRVKPSSGYAFRRIQLDAAAVVRSLLTSGHPFDLPRAPGRYRRYDAALLDVIASRGGEVASLFTALFARNPIARIFRFLDEAAPLGEELLLGATLPPRLWLRALTGPGRVLGSAPGGGTGRAGARSRWSSGPASAASSRPACSRVRATP
jgi:lycopene beta-cyclase